MIHLQALLDRYKFKPTERQLREEAAKIVTNITGVTITEKELYVQGQNLLLKTRPIKRNEILLHYPQIMEEFSRSSITKNVTRIS